MSLESRHFFVYTYQFLDDLRFLRDPKEILADDEFTTEELASLVEEVRDRFLKAGWEGDGRIQLIWLPPFADVGIEDTWGTYVWHVKQDNNGLSWLASERALSYDRLVKQNRDLPFETHSPASIVYDDCKWLIEKATATKKKLQERRLLLQPLGEPGEELLSDWRLTAQGDLVADFHQFMDTCYLRVLVEVLNDGNSSKLNLGKFKAMLDFARLVPDSDDPDYDDTDFDTEQSHWLTRHSLISDIWRAYKFEPVDSKLKMLFGSCEFKLETDPAEQLRKHIQLRNCVQHHEGYVTQEALDRCGKKKLQLMGVEPLELKAGSKILFPQKELERFCDVLSTIAVKFDEHVSKRVRSRTWTPKPKSETAEKS